jgi:hypothetical protein
MVQTCGVLTSGAQLDAVTLEGANLRAVAMDAKTTLNDVRFDTKTRLGDVLWNGASLTQIDWARVPVLGDESAIAEAKDRQSRKAAYRVISRAYHGLSVALQAQGLTVPASRYRFRERRWERRALLAEGRLGAWFFSLVLNLLSGNGERPGRALIAYLVMIFGFAATYYALGAQSIFPYPLDALVFSLTSFHGRGFFPGGISLHDPITLLAACEAVIGLFIELIFIATFSRRFLGN